jgi:acetolactate synthase-1/2/3 large subunit
MKTAQALIKSLEANGVKYVFGVPGEENLDVLDALKDSSEIEFIVTRHEQAAGFMAATVGRFTGTPGVALATLGPGATNLVTAAAYAQLGAMPLLMITGQKPIRHSKQGSFQIINVVEMMDPITKFSKQLVEGNLVESNIREAIRLATLERPGAVLLEIPEDIAAEEIDYRPIPISSTRRPVAEHKAIAQAVELLKKAKKPLIVVGAGANRKRTSNMLTEFIGQFNIPFVNTQMGKGVVNENLPQYAGTAALSDGDFVHQTIAQADLVLNLGHDVVEKPPFIMTGERPVIHINFDSASINDIYYPQYEVIGDIANAIWQIKEEVVRQELTPKELGWDTCYHLESKKRQDKVFKEAVKTSTTNIPQVIVNTVRSLVPDDGIVTLDNGMYKLWFARHYTTVHENTLLLDNALATMGAGLPSGMAAKLINPDKKVVVVAGDGGFMMNSQELETAIRLKLDLVVLILNDNSYQMIRWKQANQQMDDYGLQFNNPDFVKYAQSYGAIGYRANTPEELVATLSTALSSPGVHVIEVITDYSKNESALSER